MKRAIILVILAGAFFLYHTAFAQWGDFSSIGENVKASDGVITQMRVDWAGLSRNVKVRAEGKFEVTHDFAGIKRLSSGGVLIFEERRGKNYRKLEIRGDESDRNLVYAYSQQFEAKPFDSEARLWFSELLREIIRETGILSRQRAVGIHAGDSQNGLLREIDKINRERSKRFYYERLLEQEGVSHETLGAVLTRIRKEFKADANLRIVLSEMLARHEMNSGLLQHWIHVTKEVNNDVTRANLLTDVAAKISPKNKELMAAFHDAAASIKSEIEKTRVLAEVRE